MMKALSPYLYIGFFFMCVFPAGSAAGAKSSARTIEGIVIKVSEGDAITVNSGMTEIKARLYGIDAPETEKYDHANGMVKRGQAFGDASFRVLASKVLHQKVRLEIVTCDHDNEEVFVVWLDKRNIDLEMVDEGWAWFDSRHANRLNIVDYVDAEKQARARKLGLWVQNSPQPPWEFRRMLARGNARKIAQGLQ